MSLIDAIVLHEKIYYLPAPLSDSAKSSPLRATLLRHNIIQQFPQERLEDLPYKAFMATLSTIPPQPPRPTLYSGDDRTPLSFQKLEPLLKNALREDEDNDLYYFPSIYGTRNDSFDKTLGSVVFALLHSGESGLYEAGANSLRAMFYIFASEHYKVPYLPSAGVERAAHRFPNYFEPSVRVKLYEKLAVALNESINAIENETRGSIILVPPFTALALHRAATPSRIIDETLALREEYAGFRKNMQELENDLQESGSIGKRLKVVKRVQRLGQEVSRPFDQIGKMRFQSTLRYIPDAIDVASNPTNPASWGKALFELPADALISWYARRPVAKLTTAGRVIGRMATYDTLIEKHFGKRMARGVYTIQRTGDMPLSKFFR